MTSDGNVRFSHSTDRRLAAACVQSFKAGLPDRIKAVVSSKLNDGANELKKGSTSLKDGLNSLKDGANSLKDGSSALSQNSPSIKGGAEQIFNAILLSTQDTINAKIDEIMEMVR